jgi:anti-sigma regulatory factor (Ser/Thr protein kinase)
VTGASSLRLDLAAAAGEDRTAAAAALATRAAAWVDAFAAANGLDPQTVYRLQLSVEELVANAVMHARGATRLDLALSRGGAGAVELAASDDGPPFDPTARIPPAAPASVGEAAVGGLGLRLVLAAAAAARYRRDGGANRLSLSFHPAEPAP